jgi:hypothetical protein
MKQCTVLIFNDFMFILSFKFLSILLHSKMTKDVLFLFLSYVSLLDKKENNKKRIR